MYYFKRFTYFKDASSTDVATVLGCMLEKFPSYVGGFVVDLSIYGLG